MNDIFDDYEIKSKENEETYRNTYIKKKSILGIISASISLVVVFLVIASIGALVAAFMLEIPIENDNAYVVIGLVTILLAFCALIGAIFGIGNLLEKNTKKIFGIIGLVSNGLFFLGILLVVIIGLLLGE